MRELNYDYLKKKQWDKDILGYMGLFTNIKENNTESNLINLDLDNKSIKTSQYH